MGAKAGALLLASLVCLLLGCATPDGWVEHCETGERLQPTDECMAIPETLATAHRLNDLISDAADPLAVLVDFDDQGKVGNVCTVRSSAPKQWGGQMKLKDSLEEIYATPAGPACLAGRTLTFNMQGALVGLLKSELRDCQTDQGGGTGEYDRVCIEMRQLERGELWFFNTRRNYPYVFVPDSPEAAERHQALFQCSDDPSLVRITEPEYKQGFTYGLPRLTACMEKLGWRQTL